MFCKKCGGWIDSEEIPCEYCGAVKGITKLMQAQGYTYEGPQKEPEQDLINIEEFNSAFKAQNTEVNKQIENNPTGEDNSTNSTDNNSPLIEVPTTEESASNDTINNDLNEDFSNEDDDFSTDPLFAETNVIPTDKPQTDTILSQSKEDKMFDDSFDDFLFNDNLDTFSNSNPTETKDTPINNTEIIPDTTSVIDDTSEPQEETSAETVNLTQKTEDVPSISVTSETPTETTSLQEVIQNAKPAPKKTKKPTFLFVILILVIAIVVLGKTFLPKFLEKEPSSTTTTTTTATTTTTISTTITTTTTTEFITNQYATINFVTEAEAYNAVQNQDNVIICGRIHVISPLNNQMRLETDNGVVIFNIEKQYDYKDFVGCEVIVIGEEFYDEIQANQVYIFKSEPTTTTTTTTTQAPPSVPVYIPPQTQYHPSEPITSKSTTTTTTRTQQPPQPTKTYITPKYITKDQADGYMREWKNNPALINNSGVVYGTVNNVIISGELVCLKTNNQDIYFYTKNTSNAKTFIGKNFLASAKSQSGRVFANILYIY